MPETNTNGFISGPGEQRLFPHPPGYPFSMPEPIKIEVVVYCHGTADGITDKVKEDFVLDEKKSIAGLQHYSREKIPKLTLEYRVDAASKKLYFSLKAETEMPRIFKIPKAKHIVDKYLVNPKYSIM